MEIDKGDSVEKGLRHRVTPAFYPLRTHLVATPRLADNAPTD
jgi:hypothetical protein